MGKITTSQLKTLCSDLLKAGGQFRDYNFRHYVIRKTQEDFSRCEQQNYQGEQLDKFYAEQEEHLSVVQRQTVVQNMYFQQEGILDNNK